MKNRIPSFLLKKPLEKSLLIPAGSPLPMAALKIRSKGRLKNSFIDKGLKHTAGIIKTAYAQWDTASGDGFFQRLDARIKMLFLIYFIVIVSLKRGIFAEAAVALFIFALAAVSRINLLSFYKRIFMLGFFFGFLIALPSSVNIITGGEIVIPLTTLARPYDLWIYKIPQHIGITKEGINGVGMLTMRVINSVSLSLLVLHTTGLPEIIRALKIFRAPDAFLMMLALTYKYIFIFARTVEEMHLAKKSRLAGEEGDTEGRRWIAGRIAYIFRKTRLRCEDIYKAMQGRGFAGDVRLLGFGRIGNMDWMAGIFLFFAGVVFLWI